MKIHISPGEFIISASIAGTTSFLDPVSIKKPISVFKYLLPDQTQENSNIEICTSRIWDCLGMAQRFMFEGENHTILKRDSVQGALTCALLCGVPSEKVNTFSRIINKGHGLKEKSEDYDFFARSFTLIRDFMVRAENLKSFETGKAICAIIENALSYYDSGKKFPETRFGNAERIYFNRIMLEGFDIEVPSDG